MRGLALNCENEVSVLWGHRDAGIWDIQYGRTISLSRSSTYSLKFSTRKSIPVRSTSLRVGLFWYFSENALLHSSRSALSLLYRASSFVNCDERKKERVSREYGCTAWANRALVMYLCKSCQNHSNSHERGLKQCVRLWESPNTYLRHRHGRRRPSVPDHLRPASRQVIELLFHFPFRRP